MQFDETFQLLNCPENRSTKIDFLVSVQITRPSPTPDRQNPSSFRCDIEQELSARITRVCSGGGLAGLRPLSEVVQEMEASLLTPPRPTAPPADRTDAEGHQDAVEHGGHAVKLMAVGMERDGLKGGGAGTEPEPETDMEPGTRTGKGPGPEPERGEARGRDELLDNGVEGESLGKNAGVADRDGFQEDGVMEVAQSGLNRVEMAEDLVRTTGLLRTEKPCVGSRIGVVEKGRDERDNMDLGRGSNKRSREDYLEGEREPDTEKSGLGKRLRGADFSGSRDNAPRIAAEAEQPSPGRRADPPIGDERFARIAGQRLVRPGPFSPNLAASFQLEERLEGIAPEEGRAEGKRPEGERPEEEVAEEEKPGATRLEGRRPEEEGPEAEWSEERPEEGGTKAKSPKEGRPEGRRPEEDRQERKRPEEDGPKGRRPETERPEGKRPEEEWPEGQRPEEEWPDESGSKEAPGSDEIDWGKVGDRKGGRQGDASAPAFGCAEEGFRGGKRRELDGSETERGRELVSLVFQVACGQEASAKRNEVCKQVLE